MEQVIKSELIEREIRGAIETEYGITAKRTEDAVIFAAERDETKLCLVPRAAAMRRNPPLPGANRLPCMADVVRVEPYYISSIPVKEAGAADDCVEKLMTASLAYQYRMWVPFTLIHDDNGAAYEGYGFHDIYDKQEYQLNEEIITPSILKQAENGEIVSLNPSNIMFSALNKRDELALAHFVNASLCKKYGLFVIRNAVYYEKLQRKLVSQGGNIYLIKENDKLRGYFTYINSDTIGEVVFENEFEIERYFHRKGEKKPVTMARIVNLPEMLRHISSRGKVTVAIRLTDPIISENDGLFIWYLDENGSRMERIDEPKGDLAAAIRPEITTTIGELTAFFFEYIKLKQNMKFDSIYLSGPAWINEII